MHRYLRAAAAAALVVASLFSYSNAAEAHETRMLGKYRLVVGFLLEPPFAGATGNGVDVRITDTSVTPAKAVEGVEKTLTADVISGGLAPLSVMLATRFGQPGAYAGYFVPTKEGTYIFRLKGKIETLDVDEKFESGPGRFNDVQSTTAMEYPVKVLSGIQLGDRLAAVQAAVDQTRVLSLVGVVLGIVALGGLFLTRRRA